MFTFRKAGPLALAGMCAHCAAVPDMPPDYMLPVRDIVLHAACELRTALHEVNKTYPGFDAAHWAIGITLTPKVDTEVSLRAGLTGKSTSIANPGFFNSWIIGSGPGAEYDSKGHKDGSVKYSLSSAKLLDDRAFPLNCNTTTENYHALVRALGIQDWLVRTAGSTKGPLGDLTKADSPTFNAGVIIQWDGAGSFTYNYPFGTDFFGGYGSYKVDEAVAIAFTYEPAKKPVRTLPGGTEYSSIPVPGPSGVSAAAQSKLDFLSLEQTIRNLETATQRRR